MGWSDDGKPLEKQVLGHKKAKQYASDILIKWKGWDQKYEQKEAQALADKYLDSNNFFATIWKNFDETKDQSGSLEMTDAQSFAKAIIPKPEITISDV